jgi:hypothetical protein
MKKNTSYHLKHLTEQEYAEAPEDVRRVYISTAKNIPIPGKEKLDIIKQYPGYFEEVSHNSFSQKLKRAINLKQAIEKAVKKKSQYPLLKSQE